MSFNYGWKFRTNGEDIGFAVYFDANGDRKDMEQIFPYIRLECSIVPVEGTIIRILWKTAFGLFYQKTLTLTSFAMAAWRSWYHQFRWAQLIHTVRNCIKTHNLQNKNYYCVEIKAFSILKPCFNFDTINCTNRRQDSAVKSLWRQL
uniref:LAGLIDADG homing endonuclease n=1 Tax=Romanomermis culicivorax TaxID=13658 RepID=A0A915ITL5_ROMCU